MNLGKVVLRAGACAMLMVCARSAVVWAQKAPVPSRVTETVDDTRTVRVEGNVHPWARPANDQGAVADSQPMTRMLLLLHRSETQEQALRELLDAQQTKGSGSYHAWLAPEDFGKQFGPSDSDVQAVTDWLTRQGFAVKKVGAGRTTIEFDGNAGQVRNAFHTEVHRFTVDGEEHVANVSDPQIPEALAPVVKGVVALHNFPKQPQIRNAGTYRRYNGSAELHPLFTYGNPANYAIGPQDWATIYNVPSGATGAGQTIAIVGRTNINTQDIVQFRSLFGLPAYSSVCTSSLPPSCQFSVVINGVDPGIQGPNSATDDELEADLDSEWAGAVAPAANIVLVVSQITISNPTQISDGADLSALYIVDNNIGSVLSDSYGNCEAVLLTAGNQFYNSLWQQAAAQGITVSVAAGDNGPAACDPSTDPNAATQGLAVSGLASTPYNVAVGGTDFDPSTTTTNASSYWNQTSGTLSSAIKYMPETTWDNSSCAMAYPTACNSVDTSGNATDISAGSGGPSNCTVATTDNSGNITCTSGANGYAKPAWQSSLTPSDSVRDIPDVSFFANFGISSSNSSGQGSGVGLVACESDVTTNGSCDLNSPYQDFTVVGGTSAATPTFAAVMALVNQSTGQRQGNANYVLYNLASSDSNYTGSKCTSSLGQAPATGCVFNDVTKGNNSVACDNHTPDCSNQSGTAGFGVIVCATGAAGCPTADAQTPAFQAAAKYDLATGLGSINVGNLLTKWNSAIRTATTTTVTTVSGGASATATATATVTVAPSAATGNVSLIALDSSSNVIGTIGTDTHGNPFTLSGGNATITGLLPAGTVSVKATYGGNATYAVSTSAAKLLGAHVGGAGYTAKTNLYFVSYNCTATAQNPNGVCPPATSSQNFVYGTAYILQIAVSQSNGNSCAFSYPNTKPTFPCPTGTVTLTGGGNDFLNNGSSTNKTALNNLGIAEDQPINLSATNGSISPGVYSLQATYSGDGNYAPGSPSNTLSITIQKAATGTQLSSSISSITSGQNVTLTATVTPNLLASGVPGNGNAPCGTGSTGTVQFTSNGTALTGSVTYAGTPGQTSPNGASCTASLTTAISSLYPPPGGAPRGPAVPVLPLVLALLSLLLFALGLRWVPQTRHRAYAYAGLLGIALLVGSVAGCGGGGGGGGGSIRTLGAVYSGDANYSGSTAKTIPITVH